MGCCCPKEKNENDADERTGSHDNQQSHGGIGAGSGSNYHQKSRFLDQPGLASASHHHLGGGTSVTSTSTTVGGVVQMNGGSGGGHLLNDSNMLNDNQLNSGLLDGGTAGNVGMISHVGSGNVNGPNGEDAVNNHMFEKILSEVIHVSAYGDQRVGSGGLLGANGIYSNGGADLLHNHGHVHDMPFKLKEPQFDQQQQLTLPEGVPAPLTVLAAQPPFVSDIRLINILATEASNCINNFSLNVPENVAFDFKPVV